MTFYLTLSEKKDANPQREIRMRFKHGKLDQAARTNIFIPTEFIDDNGKKISIWDENSQQIIIPKFRTQTPEKDKLLKHLTTQSEKLNALIATIQTQFNELDRSSIGAKWLKTVIDKFSFPERYIQKEGVATAIPSFFQFIESFIEAAPNRRSKKTGRQFSEGIIKDYRSTQKRLKDYAKSINKEDFKFTEIDKFFYDGFVEWLQGEKLTTNTVGKHITMLKTVLGEAERKGYYTYHAFRQEFHKHEEDVDKIYLNEKELQRLKETDFSNMKYLDQTRDLFLLLCWTGCRFSDLDKIIAENIKDNRITFRQKKTNAKVVIPLHETARQILEKYNYTIPVISNHLFNKYIKVVCSLSGICSDESMTQTVGGKLVTKRFAKWEQVGSHTGRRSFASNMYKSGKVPIYTIMKITGHTTEKAFLKYIRISEEEHAQIMEDAWKNF